VLLGITIEEGTTSFVYGAITLYSRPFQNRSTRCALCNFPTLLQMSPIASHYTGGTTPAGFNVPTGLGCSRFARRYSGNRFAFFSWRYLDVSVPSVILIPPMDSAGDDPTLLGSGCPIRRSPGLSLFATHRGLSQLTTPFIGSPCQGIHHMPLVT
jgi:hypothetical protein